MARAGGEVKRFSLILYILFIFFLYFQILKIKRTKPSIKINYERGHTLNSVQILLEVHVCESSCEIEAV